MPCIRPSIAGQIPIFGQSPTKRPEVVIVVMVFLSRWPVMPATARVGVDPDGPYSGISTPMVSRRFA